MIRPDQATAFLAALPIDQFHGVGPATARRMLREGILTGADLQARTQQELVAMFGRIGAHFWSVATGCDDRPVSTNQPRRSLSVETTFRDNLVTSTELASALTPLADELASRVERAHFRVEP